MLDQDKTETLTVYSSPRPVLASVQQKIRCSTTNCCVHSHSWSCCSQRWVTQCTADTGAGSCSVSCENIYM